MPSVKNAIHPIFCSICSLQLSIIHVFHKFIYYTNVVVNNTHTECYQTFNRLCSTTKETSFSMGSKNLAQ